MVHSTTIFVHLLNLCYCLSSSLSHLPCDTWAYISDTQKLRPWLADSSRWPWVRASEVKAKPCNSWAMWLFCSSLFGVCSWLGAASVGNLNGVSTHSTFVSSVGPFWIREGHAPQDCVKFITLCTFSCSQLSTSKSHTQRLSSVHKTFWKGMSRERNVYIWISTINRTMPEVWMQWVNLY